MEHDYVIYPQTTYHDIAKELNKLTFPLHWGIHILSSKNVLFISECNINNDMRPFLSRQIVVYDDLTWKVFFSDKLISNNLIYDKKRIETIEDLQTIIFKMRDSHFCSGGPRVHSYPDVKTKVAAIEPTGVWRHKACPLVTEMRTQCDACLRLYKYFEKDLKREGKNYAEIIRCKNKIISR